DMRGPDVPATLPGALALAVAPLGALALAAAGGLDAALPTGVELELELTALDVSVPVTSTRLPASDARSDPPSSEYVVPALADGAAALLDAPGRETLELAAPPATADDSAVPPLPMQAGAR